VSLFPRQEHVAAEAGRNVRGDGNAAVAALRHIRQGQRIVPAQKPEIRSKERAQAWRPRRIAGGIFKADHPRQFRQACDRFIR
jgi:hypothetical protein